MNPPSCLEFSVGDISRENNYCWDGNKNGVLTLSILGCCGDRNCSEFLDILLKCCLFA